MFFFSPALGRPWAEIFLYKTGVLGFAEGEVGKENLSKQSREFFTSTRQYLSFI
jgi:hypothetical protein